MKLVGIEIVEDRTAASRCDEGFLKLRRLVLRNVYEDRVSADYPCDVVSRPGSDAVVAVLYERAPDGRVFVWLREAPRAPIYLRRLKRFHHPDAREYLTIAEVVAGLVEPSDGEGEAGMRERAAIEAREEAGFAVAADAFAVIGGETFASPGTSDEKVYYCAGPVQAAGRVAAAGDGTVMEEHGKLVRLELVEALEACRRGAIPDMKTELALMRLCDHLAFLPQLGCFADELPEPLRAPPPARSGAAGVTALKIALIGARRVRQGLGPYVARHLVELGAEVPCFLGTRPESVAESERALGARGYLDLAELLAKEQPDALAILSPSETHERYLEAALAARLPVLCDKPLLWNGPGLAGRAARLVERFAAAGLLLRENCQWPYTLPAYRALHPDAGPLASFAMRLSPSSQDPLQMLGDCLSHPLSLLQALTGAAPAHAAEIALAAQTGEVRLRFSYRFAASAVPCEITLRSSDRLPREAAYAVNGRWAERRIRPSDYSFRFGDGDREVPAPDPLREMLRDTLGALRTPGAAPADPAIPARMALLAQILEALQVAQG